MCHISGFGKTALAVHWAHRMAGRFPDGQLCVNLRGFDPTGAAMEPAEALRVLLDALNVPSARIPGTVDAQIGLYRSVVAGLRLLVLLDNARDADQVRPLLPGAPGCLVVITSRNPLAALVVNEDAHAITLDLPSPGDARLMFARRVGADRAAAEPSAVERIVLMCARLPLALAVVAARVRARPAFELAAVADELRDAHGNLDLTAAADGVADIRDVFSWSYRGLSPPGARLFRLLSVHPGPDIDLYAAAALVDVPLSQARMLVSELTRTHLVDERALGRYTFHDLLRAYAAQQADTDGRPEREEALDRVLHYYVHSAAAADRILYPHRTPIALDDLPPGSFSTRTFSDARAAQGWFTVEYPVLVAVTLAGCEHGLVRHAWQLAQVLATFLDRHARWQEAAVIHRAALAAADRLGDRAAQASAHRQLGRAYGRLGRRSDGTTHHRAALTLYEQLDDKVGQAVTHLALSVIYGRYGEQVEALTHARRTLELARTLGNEVWQARALNSLGWNNALLGRHDEALRAAEQALTLHRGLRDRVGEASVLDCLGYIHHQLGQPAESVRHYRRSLDLWREMGGAYEQADTLSRLGQTHRDAGDPDSARDCWQQALTILEELHHPDAANVQRYLDGLTPDGTRRT